MKKKPITPVIKEVPAKSGKFLLFDCYSLTNFPKFAGAATVFTVFALIMLLILGSWQVQRLLWKNNLIAEISGKAAMPAVKLSGDITDFSQLQYRKIIVTGNFMHEKEVHLFTGAKEMRGEPGYNILTPLLMKDGGVIIIDRGWVPAKYKEKNSRPETLSQGEISVTGMVHFGEHQGLFTPENDLAKNLWFWIDMPAIAGFTGKEIKNVYVRALNRDNAANALPIAGDGAVVIRNDHLQYAIIWYSFAVILLIIYIIYIRGLLAGVKNQVENPVKGKVKKQATIRQKKTSKKRI